MASRASSSTSSSLESPVKAGSNAGTELSSDQPPVVLVVGCSLSGLSMAVALHKLGLGCEVHVYEQKADVGPSSEAGVQCTEQLQAFLHAHDIPIKGSRIRSAGRQVLSHDGECAVQDCQQQEYVSWSSLKRALLAKLPPASLHFNSRVVAADLSDPTGAAIELESGERVCGDLILAADGMSSTLRNQLLPNCQPTYAGYLAWRGIAHVDDLSAEVQHLLAGKTTMYKGPYLHVQVHPLAAADSELSSSKGDGSGSSSGSSQRLAWTWFNNQVEDELSGLLLDQNMEFHAHAVPIGEVNPAVADAVAAAAASALPPPIAELIAASSSSLGVTVISDMVLSGCVISNKVALVGKAGSVVRPHCCSAAQRAFLEAASLAECLRAAKMSLHTALPRWEKHQVRSNLAACQEAVAAGERMQGFTTC